MCISDIYRSIGHDGVHRETREIRRCTAFKRGIPCDPIVYRHPVAAPRPTVTPSPASSVGHSAPVDIPNPSPRYSSTGAYFPPSPRLTPGQNTPVTYHTSDSEGDRSAASSSASREKRRPRRPSVYVSSAPPHIVEAASSPTTTRRRTSTSYHHSSKPSTGSSSTRIVIVEAPPTSRTPPQAFDAPRTAPSSPSFPATPAGEENLRYRPVIVDERPRESRDSKHHQQRVRIEVPGSGLEVPSGSAAHHQSQRQSSGGHRRQASDGSHRSRGSSGHGSGTSDEERRHRRREKERAEAEAQEEARRQKRESRIAQANLKISLRPTQPLSSRRPAPAPVYIRPTVDLPATPGLGLVSPPAEPVVISKPWAPRPGPVIIDDEDDEENEEAREQRLRERMMPHRRATIGAGSRRHRVEYQDGMYRLE